MTLEQLIEGLKEAKDTNNFYQAADLIDFFVADAPHEEFMRLVAKIVEGTDTKP